MIIVYRVLLIILFGGILYIAFPQQMANVYMSGIKYTDDKRTRYEKVLSWYPQHKEALAQLAVLDLSDKNYIGARDHAIRALENDPSNGRAMSVLITAYDQLGDEIKAERAVKLATQLWPSHAFVRVQSSDFWAKRGALEKALSEWNVLLSRHSGFYKDLFPVLKVFAETKELKPLLIQYRDEPASWWGDFFAYLTRQNTSMNILAEHYRSRITSGKSISDKERRAYINRLLKERQWISAYSAWMGGLNDEQRKYIGLVYDGGFESVIKPSSFSWQYRSMRQARLRIASIQGVKGKKGFQVTFSKGKPVSHVILSQRLMLQPGQSYKVSFMSKMSGLKNPVGLGWFVKCADESKQVLGSSEPLLGRTKWVDATFEIDLPSQDCRTQLLELKSASNYHHERFFQGSAWFDEIKIDPLHKQKIEAGVHE